MEVIGGLAGHARDDIDVACVTSLPNDIRILRTAARPGIVAKTWERKKYLKYVSNGLLGMPGVRLTPFIMEHAGRIGTKGLGCITQMADWAEHVEHMPRWFFFSQYIPLINCALMQGNLRCVLKSASVARGRVRVQREEEIAFFGDGQRSDFGQHLGNDITNDGFI